MNLWHLIFIIIFCIAFEIKSVKIRPNFDEIFGEEWEKKQSEEILIKIEQNEQNENIHFVVQLDEENGNGPNDQQKREIIREFEAIKEKLKQKGKYENKTRSKIETKLGKVLGASRRKIYKWKKEMNLNKNKIKKQFYDEKKREFIERFGEFKELYGQRKQKEFAKEFGISEMTFWKWKKELAPKYHKSKTKNKYSNEDKLQKMKQYFKMKERNPKIGDRKIAEKLEIGNATLTRWKKEFVSDSEM